ncbi:unnamed protein product, partial [Porites lobata]
SLPDSAVGLWLQQEKMVRRVCHREVAHMRDTRDKIRHALSYSRFVSSDPSKNANALQSAHCYGPVVLNSLQMKLLLLLSVKKKKTHLVPPINFSLKQVCLGTNLCIASPSEVTTIRNLNGLQDIISAMNCTCAPRERGCRRLSAEHVHFRGTKYETRIDVGQCI